MKTDTHSNPHQQGGNAPDEMPTSVQELILQGLGSALVHNSPEKGRSVIASQCLAALLANPTFTPHRNNDGEESADDAFARRAVDYADALISELQRRKGKETL